jgi:hypothetical protein
MIGATAVPVAVVVGGEVQVSVSTGGGPLVTLNVTDVADVAPVAAAVNVQPLAAPVGTTMLKVAVVPEMADVRPVKLTPVQLLGVSVTLPVSVPVCDTTNEAIVIPDCVLLGED